MGKQMLYRGLWHSLGWRSWGKTLQAWATLLSIAVLPLSALAHAQVLRSTPSDQARLARSPRQLEIWFSELLEDGFNSAQVYPAGQSQSTHRTNLVEGTPKVDVQDRTHLIVRVRSLTPGDYVFEWRVLSRDGHSAPGKINFHVLAPQEAAQSGWNTPRSTPSN